MNRTTKIFLGILTFLPLIASVSVGAFAIYQIISMMFSQDMIMPMLLFSYLQYALPLFFFFALFDLGLLIFYLVHIGRNNILDNEKKFLWIVVVITLNAIAMPIYWYVHVWNEKSELNSAAERPYESPRTESAEF